MSANNPLCRYPGEGLSWINDSDTTDNIVNAFDGSCCWAGLAIPENVAASSGKQHHYSESNQCDVITDNYVTYNGQCGTGTIHWNKNTLSHQHEQGSTVFAKRFVFGMALRACWVIGPYGTPVLRLTAKVFYKDYYNVRSHYYYKLTRVTEGYAWSRLDGANIFGPICTLIAPFTTTTVECETGVSGIPSDSTVPNPTQCLDCDPATNVNFTNQPRLIPNDCGMEFIQRTIDIPTDSACSLVGTHVFPSSGPETIKYAAFYQCCQTGLGCGWKFPVQHPLGPCPTCEFPADSDVTIPYTSFGMTQLRTVVTKDILLGPLRMAGDDRVVMNWWTEPWTITIS